MIFGIDASRTVAPNRTGTENYALHLMRALQKHAGLHRLRFYFNTPPPADLLPCTPQTEVRIIPWPRLWTHTRLALEIACHKPSVLFVPSHVLPLVCPVPAVVTVHDLGYLAYPTAHRRFDRWYLHWTTRRHARVATHILVDSAATRQDLIRHYGAHPDRITVVYPGLAPGFRPDIELGRLAAVRARYGLHTDYIIHVGTLQPRKNIGRLLEAFEQLIRQGVAPDLQLVLAGKTGWLTDGLLAQARRLQERVHIIGHVPQPDLPPLVAGARALVMPSLYEGFGFPVLEAMACGTPVVCSNTSSLPEVAGQAALLVDPHDIQALAHAIEQILHDEPLRATLRERGLERAQRFSWPTAAKQTLRILEGAAETG